ncbi:MAG TPA: hypothetical protein VGR15_04955, partial [Bacteroidota bacterium]|nr:hypothetical protein [Bacteroidota bacterium]
MLKLIAKVFPSKSEKDIRRILPLVEEINKNFEQYQTLTDEELKGKTFEFRKQIKGETEEIEAEIAATKERLKTEQGLSIEDVRQIATEIEELQKTLDETTDEILD